MKKILLIFVSIIGYFTLSAQDIAGQWNGSLEIQGAEFRIIFNIENASGFYKATMDSPDQGAKSIPVTSIHFDNKKLNIEIKDLNFRYEGALKNGTLIEGSFTQMGHTFPLNITKGEVKLKRPQEPGHPYPYTSEDVTFENSQAGIKLAGTLTYPKSGNNFPAVVLITGSGPQNRDEEILGHKPFLVLSNYLTRNGIAVLRYDDRGVSESGGNFANATTQDFASDALSAFDYLKTRKEINPKKIGLTGHSEGGVITFMLAAQDKDIAFIVSMAGSAIKGDKVLYEQRKMISKASGVSSSDFEKNEDLINKLEDIISKHSAEYIKQNIDSISNIIAPPELTDAQRKAFSQQIIQYTSPWMQYFLKYDPGKDICKIQCPIFAINGEKDLQVNAEVNLNAIKELNPKAITKQYPNLNHLFQHCQTGLMNEYSQIEETISQEVLKDIADWILNLE